MFREPDVALTAVFFLQGGNDEIEDILRNLRSDGKLEEVFLRESSRVAGILLNVLQLHNVFSLTKFVFC